ncbi:MAG: sensor histidine kinase [Thermogutta sp.]
MGASFVGFIIILSVLCQLAAAWIAFRIARLTHPGWGWLLIAGAMILMAVRRASVLGEWWGGLPVDPISEGIGLLVSVACLAGVLLIKPVLDVSWRYQTFMEMETQRLSAILQVLPGLVYRCRNDPQWTMEFISDGCRELTGYSPEDLVGNRRLAYAEMIVPEDRDSVWQGVQAAIAEKRPYRLVYRIRTADGQIKWVWEQGRGVFDEEGEVLFLTGYITDVTTWRTIEEELRKAQSNWEKEKQEWVKEQGQLLRRVWHTYEHQSETIAYEVHDGCVQTVTAALMNLEAYRHQRQASPEVANQLLDRATQLLRDSIAEARRLIQGLRPAVLEEGGLIPALETLVRSWKERTDIQIHLENRTEFVRLAPPVELNLFRIIQEAVRNAVRHSQSREIAIQLVQEGSQLHVEIRDWGVGFDPDRVSPERFGLISIRDRARMLGGWAEIDSQPGKGTCVRVVIPIHPEFGAPLQNGPPSVNPVSANP